MLASKIKEIRNGRVIVKDSKIGDANPDGTISPDEEKRMAELLREANESKSRLKAKAYEIGGSFRGPGNWKRVKSILTSDSKTKDRLIDLGNYKGVRIYEGTENQTDKFFTYGEGHGANIGYLAGYTLKELQSKIDAHLSKTKDAKTKHEYKGYVLEWDNENNKIPAKIISPKGQVIFTYAIGAEPTITGFNSKVELDLSKTKDGEAEESFIKANLASGKIDYIAAAKELMSLGYSQPDAMRTVRIWLGKVELDLSKTKDANIVNAGNIKGINWEVRKDIKNGNVIYIGESDLDDMTYEGAYPAQVAKELMNWIRGHAGN